MVILNADHPDVEDFIWCKAIEERKARVLRDAGFDMDLDGKDSHSTQYQNANNSVRVTDEFMQAVVDDADWHLRAVTSGEPVRTVKARQLFRQIAEATWECADPGMQFDTTINRWHTAANTGRINGSNPCSEYMHLDNSACNLASLNLLKFLGADGTFDVDGFKAAVEVVFTAQEILVGNADYPTEKIGDNARRFRQLGLGYANLGAMLMALGLAYDSDAGRTWAAAITSLMTGHAYATSARTAARMGPFAGYSENREPMNRVLRMHRDEASRIDDSLAARELVTPPRRRGTSAVEWAEDWGVRNSQATFWRQPGAWSAARWSPPTGPGAPAPAWVTPTAPSGRTSTSQVATDEGARHGHQVLRERARAGRQRRHRPRLPHPGHDSAPGEGGRPSHRRVGVEALQRHHRRRPRPAGPGPAGRRAADRCRCRRCREAYWTGEHHVEAPRTMSAELAEIIGYFMGDGSLHSRGLRFCVAESDFDVVERLRAAGQGACSTSRPP